MIRWLPRTTSSADAERRLAGMTDGIDQVVAIEVYDHPDSKLCDRGALSGQVTGPWLLGPEDECRAELARLGYEDFEIKASVGMGRGAYDTERG